MRSGRGLWAFWLLRNTDPRYPLAGPVRAWPDNLELWHHIQRGIGERLSSLAPDPAARDAVRVARVPGSLHSGTGRQVVFWSQFDGAGQEFSYTLDEMAEFFGVACSPPRQRKRTPEPDAVRRGHLGRRGWALKARRQFERLRSLRGGCRDGHRHRAALLYATILRRCGLKQEEALEEVKALGDECRTQDGKAPMPLPHDEVLLTVNTAFTHRSNRNIRNDTISDWFEITPEEARSLETWKPASRFGTQERVPTRAERQARRRAAISALVNTRDRPYPTLRDVRRHLVSLGLAASLATIANDWRVLRSTGNWSGMAPTPPEDHQSAPHCP